MILTVLLWCAMDPINVSPNHGAVYIPAPAGSVMAMENHHKKST